MEKLEQIKSKLRKQKYAFAGNHSAVQVCQYTKNSLLGKPGCWKEKFYGIQSHRCCQMSPTVVWCENQCLHCWRPIELNLGTKLEKIDEPKEIIDKIVEERKKFLIGYKGIADKKRFEEAINPNLFTLSLSGEATLYPKLPKLIREIKSRKAICFLVTNGQNPGMISKLKKEKSLPAQITLSTNAPNEKLFKIWHNSLKKDAWNKFNETIDLLRRLNGKTRKVIRLTLVKKGKNNEKKFNEISNMEDENVKEYADLVRRAEPNFIHVKGFMSIGAARGRMGYDKMPWHYEVREFAEKLSKELKNEKYKILNEDEKSCVVVLGKSKVGMKFDFDKLK